MLSTQRGQIWFIRAVVIAAVVGGWEILARSVEPSIAVLVSSPALVAKSLLSYAKSGLILQDSLATFTAASAGFLLGAFSGIVAGIALSLSRTLAKAMDPILAAVNSVPRPALAPLLILWFGFGMTSRVLLAASLVFFLMLYNTLSGVLSIDRSHARVVYLLGASRRQTIRVLVIPSISTWLVAAVPNALSYALIGTIIGELVGSSEGLGVRLSIAASLFDTDRAFAILVWLMATGGALLLLARQFEQRMTSWRVSDRSTFGPASASSMWPLVPPKNREM